MMERPVAVWIKHGQARVFRFQDDLRLWSVHTLTTEDRKALFHKLATELSMATEILLLGPDLAKYQFRNHLVEQHPLIARRLTGCEAYGQEPDAATAAWSRRYWERIGVAVS
jgi:hypothetical protein